MHTLGQQEFQTVILLQLKTLHHKSGMTKLFYSRLVDCSGGWRLLGGLARAENPLVSGRAPIQVSWSRAPGKRPTRTEINPRLR